MFKTVWGRVIAFTLVGAVGLLLGGFVVSAFLPHSALAGNMMSGVSAVTGPSTSTTRVTGESSATSTNAQGSLREQVARMLQERMGLSQQDADSQAATMADHMQQVHGDRAADILKQCTDNTGDMMTGNGTSSMMGAGAVSGGSHESHHSRL